MKKIISLITTSAMLISMNIISLAVPNEIEYSDPAGYIFRYVENSTGITIEKCIYDGNRDLVIPKEVDGKTVTAVGADVTDGNFDSLTIEADITELPEKFVFSDSRIKTVILNEGLIKIGYDCFSDCQSLRSVSLPESLTEIGLGAFADSDSLSSIKIPSNVNKIGTSVLYDCNSLSSIEWDMTAEECGADFAENTPWLREYSKDHDWLALNNETYLVRYIGSDKELVIPEHTKINQYACSGNDTITSVTVNEKYPDYMFAGCTNIRTAVINTSELSKYMFSDCSSLENVVLSNDTTVIEASAFLKCTSLKTIDLPDGLEVIGDSAFSCSGIEEIDIPKSVTAIKDDAFSRCDNLTSVKLPDGLRELGKKAFYGCKNLKSVNIPSGVANSLDGTFVMCRSLENVTCDTVTESIYFATQDTPWHTEYENDPSQEFFIIGTALIKYNGTDKNPKIPDGVKTINSDAFLNSDIESVEIPASVETIGSAAFYGTKLKKLTIPSTVKTVMGFAFAECKDLEELTINGGTIEDYAFTECSALKDENIKISENANVDKRAFAPIDASAAETIRPDDPATTQKPTVTEAPKNTDKPESTPLPEKSAENLNVTIGGNVPLITIDGTPVTFTDAQPFIDENGRTQVPVRAVAEMLGCEVNWDEATGTVTVTKGNETITLVIGKTELQKNQSITEMDTAPVIINDRTYIPVRFVGEALGLKVTWNG